MLLLKVGLDIFVLGGTYQTCSPEVQFRQGWVERYFLFVLEGTDSFFLDGSDSIFLEGTDSLFLGRERT